MISTPSRVRIEWPQSACELITGSLVEIFKETHLLGALPESPTGQVLLRDSGVAPEALNPIRDFFSSRGALQEFEVQGGESCKSPESWFAILELLGEAKLDRGGLLIVAGGGALGDSAGFAASAWHRGIPWVAIPTTLLAMVDAHVGGKTAIQQSGIKNRIGSFHLPRAVITDPVFLQSLPMEERSQGWAELIKAAWIGDPDLLQELEALPDTAFSELVPTDLQIAAAVKVKVQLVEEDPHESGVREFLNLGHTLAHALEMNVTPRLLHGQAVSIGMVFAGALSEELKLAPRGTASRIRALLKKVGLPVDWSGVPVPAVLESILSDKKVRSGSLRWVLPRAPGEMVVQEVSLTDVKRLLEVGHPGALLNSASTDRRLDG